MKITVENLSKRYDEKHVFANLHATFTSGAPVALMGESGIGKTTLLRILLGLEQQDSGAVQTEGIAYYTAVFQEDRLCEEFSALKNLQMVCPPTCTEEELAAHLQAVGLAEEEMQKPVQTLSGGQKRRVAIVRSMLGATHEDDFAKTAILMDEPFKGLDVATKQKVIDYILKQRNGRLLLVVTHSEEEATALGATTVVFEEMENK